MSAKYNREGARVERRGLDRYSKGDSFNNRVWSDAEKRKVEEWREELMQNRQQNYSSHCHSCGGEIYQEPVEPQSMRAWHRERLEMRKKTETHQACPQKKCFHNTHTRRCAGSCVHDKNDYGYGHSEYRRYDPETGRLSLMSKQESRNGRSDRRRSLSREREQTRPVRSSSRERFGSRSPSRERGTSMERSRDTYDKMRSSPRENGMDYWNRDGQRNPRWSDRRSWSESL